MPTANSFKSFSNLSYAGHRSILQKRGGELISLKHLVIKGLE